ncbi:MAG: cytochrome c [Sheuella sp.]|nr:cytochrome c [Sheuella sp.]
MKKLSSLILTGTLASALWVGSAQAQFAKPEDAVKYRQSALQLIASHFGRMQPVMKGQVPYDAAAIKANVELLKTLSVLPWAGFVEGSQAGTSAKPEVWSDAAGFKAAQSKFEGAVDKLAVAANSGDLDRVRAAFGDVGASCKACHDSYRVKK